MNALAAPNAIAFGPDNALWFVESTGGDARVGRISPGGGIATFPVPTLSPGLYDIAAGSDGALWFTESFGNKIGRVTTGGAVTEYLIPTTGSSPQGIAAGPDGALWFTEYGKNKIGRISTAGAFTGFPIPTVNSRPTGIAAGPDGALWFAESNGNNIGRITTGGAITEFPVPAIGSYPNRIVAGPDGALWFTETIANIIGRISTAGVITEYSVPEAGEGIAIGPDGAVWFTEFSANKIGRLQIAMNFEGKGYILDTSLPAACASAGIKPNDEFTLVLKFTGGSVGVPPDTLAFYTDHSGAAATSTNASQSLASPGPLSWTYVTDRGFAGAYNSAGTSSMTLLTGVNAAITAAAGNIKIANGVINDFFGYAGCNIQNFHAALVTRPN